MTLGKKITLSVEIQKYRKTVLWCTKTNLRKREIHKKQKKNQDIPKTNP